LNIPSHVQGKVYPCEEQAQSASLGIEQILTRTNGEKIKQGSGVDRDLDEVREVIEIFSTLEYDQIRQF
jgi:hypothetical protein